MFIAAILIASQAGFVQAKAPSVAELLPADSMGYIELPRMEVFYYLISELGQSALQSLEEEAVPENVKVWARAVLEAFNELRPALPKSGSLGIVSADPGSGQTSLIFTAELSEGLAPLAAAASKLLPAIPELKVRKTEHGTEVVVPGLPIPPIVVAVKENVLYAAIGEGLLDRAMSGLGSDSLAQTAHFKEITAITAKDALLSAYLNLDAIQEKLRPVLPEMLNALGLKDVHAVGLSICADDKLYSINLALQFTEDAPGIPGLLSVPDTKPKGIAYVPEDFSHVHRVSLGPPDQLLAKIFDLMKRIGMEPNAERSLANLKQNAGIDVQKILASLGGEITIGIKIPESLAVPSIVICLDAKDPGYLTETFKKLLTGERAPATITEMELSGRKVMMVMPKIPVPVSPALVVDGDVMVVGTSTAVLRKALAAKDTGRNITAKDAFKAAVEGLPAENNVALMYTELNDLGQLAITALGMAVGMAPQEVKPMIPRAMPYLNGAVQDLGETVHVTYRIPGGLAIRSRGSAPSLVRLLKNGAALAAKAGVFYMARQAVTPEATPEVQEVPAERIEGDFTEKGRVFVDLDPYVTQALTAMHRSGEGNDLPFEPGFYRMGGCVYRIGKGTVQLKGQPLENVPEEVKGIKVGQKIRRLNILHATGYGSGTNAVTEGTQIGTYVINYDDGSIAEIPIKYGVDVRDWRVHSGEPPVSEGKLAWVGKNQFSQVRLYSMTWENPHPDKVVSTIDCRSAGTVCAPFLVGITAETE